MKISGFGMAKNAVKLYYPVKESILSILPLVDEFVFALGDCDEDDRTEEEILSIGSDKIKIVRTSWDLNRYPRGMENAHQTDIAKSYCSGDWLFYLQADEVVHELDLPKIKNACETYLDDHSVEGFIFKYRHFWGDYQHYQKSHGWYQNEIRIIRNDPDIHSWESAQSFRRIPGFDGINYRQQKDTFRLSVIGLDAYIYHYGWVRPPVLMKKKTKALDTIHHGKNVDNISQEKEILDFSYGNMKLMARFKDSHPKVMQEMISRFNWDSELSYDGRNIVPHAIHKHERFKYRLLTLIKSVIPLLKSFGDFKNYKLIKRI